MTTPTLLAEEAELDARFRELFYEIIRRVARRACRVVYRPHPSDGQEFGERVA